MSVAMLTFLIRQRHIHDDYHLASRIHKVQLRRLASRKFSPDSSSGSPLSGDIQGSCGDGPTPPCAVCRGSFIFDRVHMALAVSPVPDQPSLPTTPFSSISRASVFGARQSRAVQQAGNNNTALMVPHSAEQCRRGKQHGFGDKIDICSPASRE